MRSEKPMHNYVLHTVSQKFPNVAFETVPMFVWLTMALALSSFQGRSSSTSSFHASLLQAIDGVIRLLLFVQVGSQAPQHFRSSETQATCEGRFARQSSWSFPPDISLHSGMSRAVHPQEFSKVDVDHWNMPVWASHIFTFCIKLIESVRMMACMVWLSPLEANQRRAWVTASTSIVKLEFFFLTVYAAVSSWMVVTPCWTVKPHPDWSLVTEPSVYTMRSCGLLFSWMRSLISDSVLPAGHSQRCFPKFPGTIVLERRLNWFGHLSHNLSDFNSSTRNMCKPDKWSFFNFSPFVNLLSACLRGHFALSN